MCNRFIHLIYLSLSITVVGAGMAQQITINRIEQMPNQPTPYDMRD